MRQTQSNASTKPEPLSVGMETAAGMLGISQRKLHDLKEAGEIPFYRIGTKNLFEVKSLKRWIAERVQLQEQGGVV